MRKSLLLASAAAALSYAAGASAMAAYMTTAASTARVIYASTQAIENLDVNGGYNALLHQARGVVIVPAIKAKASGGLAVLLKRTGDGWSDPVFLNIGSLSLGSQTTGGTARTAMLLMTGKAMDDFAQAHDLSLGPNTGLTVVGYTKQGQAPAGKGDIVIWAEQPGPVTGTKVRATDISYSRHVDDSFYGQSVTSQQILNDRVTREAEARPLTTALQS